MVKIHRLVSLGLLLAGSLSAQDFAEEVLPFLQQHCLRCHGEEVQEAEFRIDQLSRDFLRGDDKAAWLEVLDRVSSGEMPPEEEMDRPSAAESARLVQLLSKCLLEGEAGRLAARGPVSYHRLTRKEYANTIRDLLGVDFDASDPSVLIEEDRWRGMDRIGSALSLSPAHLEKYLAAGEAILDEAYPARATASSLLRRSAIDLVGGAKNYSPRSMARLAESGDLDRIRIDLWPGQTLRIEPEGAWLRQAGRYRIRAQLSGLLSPEGRAPQLVIMASSIDRLLHASEIATAEDEPIIIDFEAHLPLGALQFALRNASPGPSLLPRIRRQGTKPFLSMAEGRIPWQLALTNKANAPLYPLLILDWVEWEGPLARDADGLAASYLPEDLVDRSAARPGLTRFAEKAFRRPLRSGEIDSYLELAAAELQQGSDPRSAIKTSMLAILCSQDFLFLREGSTEQKTERLSDWELASRLSYFLWSSMPDAELFALAREARLSKAGVLQGQVERMLAHPAAARFAEDFPRQWLQLHRVGMFPPDRELYPEYDAALERSMISEPMAFFSRVLEQNLSLREFINSDWSMLDEGLARHYGIEGVSGPELRSVVLGKEIERGGLLTQAAILSLTSDGNRQRPVHRGVWLMQSIFGEYPPPPPAIVEPIEPIPIDEEKTSFRSQLEAHRSDKNCMACHRRIDPLGLAFENYDAIGRWREKEVLQMGAGEHPAVDASGTLADGRSFADVREFKSLLLANMNDFNAAFIEKLASYALRRPMHLEDRAALAEIAGKSVAQDYRLADLIQALVLSDLFQRR